MTPPSSHLLAGAAIAFGASLGCACHDRGETAATSFTNIDSKGRVDATINGVTIEVDPAVHFEYHHETGSNGTSTIMTLD